MENIIKIVYNIMIGKKEKYNTRLNINEEKNNKI